MTRDELRERERKAYMDGVASARRSGMANMANPFQTHQPPDDNYQAFNTQWVLKDMLIASSGRVKDTTTKIAIEALDRLNKFKITALMRSQRPLTPWMFN